MRYQEIPAVVPAPPSGNRTPGIHLSRVLKKMAVANRALNASYADDLSLVEVSGQGDGWWDSLEDDTKIRLAIGMAWEDWYLPKLPTVVHQPGELQLDGVYMTPDGESLDYLYSPMLRDDIVEYAVHECKTTAKSIKRIEENGLEGQFLWLAQMKGYCRAMRTTIAYLHVLFLYGNYKFPLRPQLRVWRIEFTDRELEVSWDTVTAYITDQSPE